MFSTLYLGCNLQVVINFCKYIQWLCYKLLRLPLPLVYYWASWWSTSSAHSSWCSMLADYWYTCGMCQFPKWTLVVFCLYILFICQLASIFAQLFCGLLAWKSLFSDGHQFTYLQNISLPSPMKRKQVLWHPCF